MENLFSYGTLQLESVQLDTFKRKLEGSLDSLFGYKLSFVKIVDEEVIRSSGKTEHPIIIYTGNPYDIVKGMVFRITLEEIIRADRYEVDDYERVAVLLSSRKMAWVYVRRER